MIVCDRCGKPVKLKESLITKVKISTFAKMKPGMMNAALQETYIENQTHYDLCQECLYDAMENLSEFVKQGKFKMELNNG